MTNGTMAICSGIVGVLALNYVYRIFTSAGLPEKVKRPEFTPGEPMPPDLMLTEQQITLRCLSQIWAKGEFKTYSFENLANIWRTKGPREEKKERVPVFTHEAITQFYQNRVNAQPFFVGGALNAAIDLLELLDQQGDCPSVVNLNAKEPEKNYDADTYNMLAKVPLYQHSLNVANETMNRVGKGAVVPKAALAALAHDLGKIPYYYGAYYKSSSHPSTSLAVAETLESLKNIKWFSEIASAIKNHHIQSEEYLDNLVREGDQAARRFEMTSVLAEKINVHEVVNPVPVATPPQIQEMKPVIQKLAPDPKVEVKPKTEQAHVPVLEPVHTPEASEQTIAPVKAAKPASAPATPAVPPFAAAPVEPERQERRRVPREIKDISEWFDADRFVKEFTLIINTVQAGDRFWSALALNGYVYVKPIPFYNLIIRHSKNDAAVIAAGSSEQDRDNYLFTVVMALKERKDLVATEFLGGDRYGSVFFHNPGPDGVGAKQFLIPFRADYFGEEIDRAESRRSTLMKKTVTLASASKGGK